MMSGLYTKYLREHYSIASRNPSHIAHDLAVNIINELVQLHERFVDNDFAPYVVARDSIDPLNGRFSPFLFVNTTRDYELETLSIHAMSLGQAISLDHLTYEHDEPTIEDKAEFLAKLITTPEPRPDRSTDPFAEKFSSYFLNSIMSFVACDIQFDIERTDDLTILSMTIEFEAAKTKSSHKVGNPSRTIAIRTDIYPNMTKMSLATPTDAAGVRYFDERSRILLSFLKVSMAKLIVDCCPRIFGINFENQKSVAYTLELRKFKTSYGSLITSLEDMSDTMIKVKTIKPIFPEDIFARVISFIFTNSNA